MAYSTVTIESLTELSDQLLNSNSMLLGKVRLLEEENAALKAKIAGGVRVYVEQNHIDRKYEAYSDWGEKDNATLLLDEKEGE